MTVTVKNTGFSLCNVVAKAEPTETKSSTIGHQQHEPCSKAGKTGKKSQDWVGFDEAGRSLQQSGIFQ